MQGWRSRGPQAPLFRCPAGFGWVAETRETGKRPEPGHRRTSVSSEKGPITISSERAMNPCSPLKLLWLRHLWRIFCLSRLRVAQV
jgi:hypothetical protein